jgi:ABC-type nitrate/sulfonate/bicarbonate transport system permease component
LAITVVAEILLPSLDGLGTAISRAREMNQYTRLWALTGLLALGGAFFHTFIVALWRFSAPWLKYK